jgi:hypothetical protein
LPAYRIATLPSRVKLAKWLVRFFPAIDRNSIYR